MKKFRKCPYCGEDKNFIVLGEQALEFCVYNVVCTKCNSEGPSGMSTEEAIDLYNKRYTDPKIKEEPTESKDGNAVELAKMFANSLPDDMRERIYNSVSWSKCFEVLLKEFSYSTLYEVVDTFRNKDEFWRKNLLTPMKFVKKNRDEVRYIDYFVNKLKENRKPNRYDVNTVSASGESPDISEEIRAIIKEHKRLEIEHHIKGVKRRF